MTRSLILGSGSAVRAMLLSQAGVEFEVVTSEVDEDEIKDEFSKSEQLGDTEFATDKLALKLAEAKALAVAAKRPDALVIGADQILSCEGRRFDKPKSLDEARTNLKFFRGKPHILHGGIAIAQGDAIIWGHSDRATLTMRGFTDAFLEEYLARLGDEVLKSVGCYQIEGPGVQLFERIEGDYFTILGLPLLALLAELRRLAAVPA
ncbi:septum formation protein [Parvibaculum indicum]|uniref:Maf family nucleotide pyrophosphatase n=1 Tax=Parvibaculum indicum TaxID=562969 RepID=UPI00141FF9A8|nr:Maf family nucleotide pyrophosphatase [Parvibaculum indicum]NIJ42264.1 septum formation protein [Parvibaculum indicum]